MHLCGITAEDRPGAQKKPFAGQFRQSRVLQPQPPSPGSHEWSWRRDLNPRPSDYKSDALPAELRQPFPPGDHPEEQRGDKKPSRKCKRTHPRYAHNGTEIKVSIPPPTEQTRPAASAPGHPARQDPPRRGFLTSPAPGASLMRYRIRLVRARSAISPPRPFRIALTI